MKNTDSIAQKIRELYAITTELESLYPGRKFTIDGHLVGSIGEVLVAERYGLTLLSNSTQTHDAEAKDGRLVQIKAYAFLSSSAIFESTLSISASAI